MANLGHVKLLLGDVQGAVRAQELEVEQSRAVSRHLKYEYCHRWYDSNENNINNNNNNKYSATTTTKSLIIQQAIDQNASVLSSDDFKQEEEIIKDEIKQSINNAIESFCVSNRQIINTSTATSSSTSSSLISSSSSSSSSDDIMGTCTALTALANVHRTAGDHAAALRHHQQEVAMLNKLLMTQNSTSSNQRKQQQQQRRKVTSTSLKKKKPTATNSSSRNNKKDDFNYYDDDDEDYEDENDNDSEDDDDETEYYHRHNNDNDSDNHINQRQTNNNNNIINSCNSRLQESFCNIGSSYRELGNFKRAQAAFDQGVELASRQGDLTALARCQVGLGALELQATNGRTGGDRGGLHALTASVFFLKAAKIIEEVNNNQLQLQLQQHQQNQNETTSSLIAIKNKSSCHDHQQQHHHALLADLGLQYLDLAVRINNNINNERDNNDDDIVVPTSLLPSVLSSPSSSTPATMTTTNYMVKASCCEIEWRVLDGLEQSYVEQGRYLDALMFSDRKRLTPLSNNIRQMLHKKNQQATSSFSTSSQLISPLKRVFHDKSTLYHIMKKNNIKVMLCYSLRWSETDDARAFVVIRQDDAKTNSENDGTVDVRTKTIKLDKTFLAIMAAQDSKYHRLLVQQQQQQQQHNHEHDDDADTKIVCDTPLVPQILSLIAEREARRLSSSSSSSEEELKSLIISSSSSSNQAQQQQQQRVVSEEDINWELTTRIMSETLLRPLIGDEHNNNKNQTTEPSHPLLTQEELESYFTNNNEHLCVVADGFLSNVPFSALQLLSSSSSSNQQNNNSTKKYLIEVAPICMVPSIELLYHLTPSPPSSSKKETSLNVNTRVIDSELFAAATANTDEDTSSRTKIEDSLRLFKDTLLLHGHSAEPNQGQQQINLTTIDLPYQFDMREEFAGSFLLSSSSPASDSSAKRCKNNNNNAADQLSLPLQLQLQLSTDPILGAKNPLKISSEWIANSSSMNDNNYNNSTSNDHDVDYNLLWFPSLNDFCYRVVHETCIPLSRAFFIAAAVSANNNNNNNHENENNKDDRRTTMPPSTRVTYPRFVSSLWQQRRTSSSSARRIDQTIRNGEWLMKYNKANSQRPSAAVALRNYILSEFIHNNDDDKDEKPKVPMHVWCSLRVVGLP